MDSAGVSRTNTSTPGWWFLTWGPRIGFRELVTWMRKELCLCFYNSSHYETKQQTSIVLLSVPRTLPQEKPQIFSHQVTIVANTLTILHIPHYLETPVDVRLATPSYYLMH